MIQSWGNLEVLLFNILPFTVIHLCIWIIIYEVIDESCRFELNYKEELDCTIIFCYLNVTVLIIILLMINKDVYRVKRKEQIGTVFLQIWESYSQHPFFKVERKR